MMLNRLIDGMGDSNPQIFRELKERLTPKNIGIAIVATAIVQVFVLLYFNGQIPTPTYDTVSATKLVETHSSYCLFSTNGSRYEESLCKLSGSGGYLINWQKWWTDVYICLCWILPMGVILGSVYTLVADLIQEEKRGTLNFIRLSPQSAQTIFIGKILGVPSLVYLAMVLALPLHLAAGINAGGSIPFLASWYVVTGSLCFLLASTAVLYVLLGGIQAILTVIVIGYPICLPLLAINAFASGTLEGGDWFRYNNAISWFGLPFGSSALWFYAFGTGCCLLASYWIWQALERRYLNPTATVIGKSQSYLVNLCLQLWIAGFVLPLMFSTSDSGFREWASGYAIVDFMALLLLIPMLLPTKQAVQDWSRYRRERVTHQPPKFWQRELVQDLISNDKSPALLAIAINIGIAMVLWIPVSVRIALINPSHGVRFLAGVCLATSLILIYTAIAHLGLFLKVRKRILWIIAGLTVAMFLPAVGAFVLSPSSTPTGFAAILLLFSPFAPLGILQLAGGSILATFAAQLAMFAALTHQLQRKLQISGQSQTKELTTNSLV
jgi:hypothetical protein